MHFLKRCRGGTLKFSTRTDGNRSRSPVELASTKAQRSNIQSAQVGSENATPRRFPTFRKNSTKNQGGSNLENSPVAYGIREKPQMSGLGIWRVAKTLLQHFSLLSWFVILTVGVWAISADPSLRGSAPRSLVFKAQSFAISFSTA